MTAFPGIRPADIYLPAPGTDLSRWAVVACDQFTSDPAYWQRVENLVKDAPSTLRLIQPEALLGQGDNTEKINACMQEYLNSGTLIKAVENGFVITERTTSSGKRIGLMAAFDLEEYDFVSSDRLTRATEGTVRDRLPPRVKIRENAPLELPHVLVLLDDPEFTVIEPAYSAASDLLYDFELMEKGGHLRGWSLCEPAELEKLSLALNALKEKSGGFLYAVGDGNHSLATAKLCWEKLKPQLSPGERENHPARFALAELVNLHSASIVFEPIHRVIFNSGIRDLSEDFAAALTEKGVKFERSSKDSGDIVFVSGGYTQAFDIPGDMLPLSLLQPWLDGYIPAHPKAGIDYIHGDETVMTLSKNENCTGILLKAIKKDGFFDAIRAGGSLPRKTFSMGNAEEKRYYLECRRIK